MDDFSPNLMRKGCTTLRDEFHFYLEKKYGNNNDREIDFATGDRIRK
jgi:hypothetical protein